MTPGQPRGDALEIPEADVLEICAGDVLCDRYRADRVIGRSETGLVVSATDLLRGGEVAIKMLEPAADEADLLTARLLREADMLAQLTSPHVVRVLDVAKHGRAVCMIMELLRGGTLAEVVRKRGPLPIEEAVGYVIQACDGIAEAHSLGIVHRDIKPQNLFLAERADGAQVVKVLDFGVSKQLGAVSGMGLTAIGAELGSPLYTAVEQFRDASRVDGRADIWAIGLVLYFLLCRRNAFDADNPVALMMRIATAPPHPLRERRPEVPPDLEAVILQCVEKEPEMRFQDVVALGRALAPFGPPWAAGFLASIEARSVRRSLPSLPPIASPPPPAFAASPAASPPPMASPAVALPPRPMSWPPPAIVLPPPPPGVAVPPMAAAPPPYPRLPGSFGEPDVPVASHVYGRPRSAAWLVLAFLITAVLAGFLVAALRYIVGI